MTTRAIYFDMDGTLNQFYQVDEWLNYLQNEDVTPYQDAEPINELEELINILQEFVNLGVIIGVISWLAMNSSNEYKKAVRQVKKEWLKKYFPIASEIHIVQYGSTKKSNAKIKNSVLVDDNEKICKGWNGLSINASDKKEMIKQLKNLLEFLR